MVLNAVKERTGSSATQISADAGYRSESAMANLARTHPDAEQAIALDREGKVHGAQSAQNGRHAALLRNRKPRKSDDREPPIVIAALGEKLLSPRLLANAVLQINISAVC